MEEITKKIRINAASTYLLGFISLIFLVNKDKNINNVFVRGHIKSAVFIHIGLLLSLIIFDFGGLGNMVSYHGFHLNSILFKVFFFIAIVLIINGINDALKGKEFKILDSIKFTTGMGLDIHQNAKFDEKDKLTILFAHIPFVGYIIGSQFKNENIKNILKLNILATAFICLIYVLGYSGLFQLFLLVYIIFICFSGVYLFVKEELISVVLPDYVLPSVILQNFKTFLEYLVKYFSGKFMGFAEIQRKNEELQKKNREEEIEKLKTLPEFKGPKFFFYIPIVNLVFFFHKKTDYIYHIRNGVILSLLFLVVLVLTFLGTLSERWLVLFLFPICFGIGNLQEKYYKMPYIYEVYELFAWFGKIFYRTKSFVKENRKKVQEVSLKVEEGKDEKPNTKD